MYIDLASDWPAYAFMALFVIFFAYIVVKGNEKHKDIPADKTIADKTLKK